ncbi:MAG: hypothetical protein KC502_22595 [Myxococcales bacterium]|nr:hypothetical protein [Myxococcales bacterium]
MRLTQPIGTGAASCRALGVQAFLLALVLFIPTMVTAAAAAPGAATPAADNGGFGAPGYPAYHLGQATVTRGEMQVQLHTRLEMRAALLTGEDNQLLRGDLAERPGFAVPRARFGLTGQFAKHIPFTVVTDLAGATLTDAWIGYQRFHYFKMWFGARTVPFSRSAILSSADAALSERSRSSNAMAPFRQIGLTVGGDYKLLGLTWRAGVYNGFDRHLNFYGGAVNSSGLHGNRFHGLSSVARIQVAPKGKMGPSVHDLTGGKLRFSVGGGAYMNDGGTTTGTGYSADLHVKAGGLHILAEWIRDDAKPSERPTTDNTIPEALTREAMSVEVGYVWRKLTFAARAELVNPNTDVENNDDEMWVSASVGKALVGNLLRVWLQYDHRRELQGQTFDNDTLLFKIMLRL